MPRLSPYTDDAKLAPLFAEETAQASQSRLFQLITLYITTADGDIEEFNIADSNFPIAYTHKTASGEYTVTYAAFPVKFAGATISSDGTIDKATISVANVSREIMSYIEDSKGLQGSKVAVKTVYEKFLDFIYTVNPDGTVDEVENSEANSSAYLEEEYQIDTYQATEQLVNFTLDPIIDLEIKVPRRRFMVDTCYWTYMDPHTCKYEGQTVLGNVTVYGGSSFSVNAVNGVKWQPVIGTKFSFEDDPSAVFTVSSVTYKGGTRSATVTTGGKTVYKPVVSADGLLTGPNVTRSGDVILHTSSEKVCEKTLAACQLRKNEANFGGFPGISGSRRIFL
ncbi:hypothetical protein [Geobacter sp. SVR]|uniref:hypothetical protein n=1 Tax=Geobacter sp. SVR TaxID=2495594 RepID=UPI00143EF78F|nr:hypothetical protein [Geobacter sp. SVR]BCS54043.1 hypothetical protein GSVR_23510 [Geobacter sp. SVR]GCF86176.1 hypothetical protein GSbR_27760 [Geobacter sp. SVR]